MELTPKKPVLQVLICTRSKDTGESCGAKGSAQLRDHLKTWAKQNNLSPEVKVTASLCLGFCEQGVAACFQPTNEWFVKIDAREDQKALEQKILDTYQKIKG